MIMLFLVHKTLTTVINIDLNLASLCSSCFKVVYLLMSARRKSMLCENAKTISSRLNVNV